MPFRLRSWIDSPIPVVHELETVVIGGYGNFGALRSMLRLTVIADACFTAPAVAFQAVSGVALVNHLGWPLESAPLAGKDRGLSPVLTSTATSSSRRSCSRSQ